MSASSKSISTFFCPLALFMLCIMLWTMPGAHAEMPDAQSRIGTQATITFSDAQGEHVKKSDPVYTIVAQVFQLTAKAMNDQVSAVPGDNVDIAFFLKNIGNGVDDVSVTVSRLPEGVSSVQVFPADEGGRASSGTGQEIDADKKGAFLLSGMKRRELRNFVVRMTVPKKLGAGEKLTIGLHAQSRDPAADPVKFSGSAITVASLPFTVTPGDAAILKDIDGVARASMNFRVTPGMYDTNGYFELSLTRRGSPDPVLFNVLKNEVFFDGEVVPSTSIRREQGQPFRFVHFVGASRSGANTNFSFGIEVPGAVRGAELLMTVRYAAAGKSGVMPADRAMLIQSKGLLVTYPHAPAAFELLVTGNSVNGAPAFSVVESAMAGQIVDFYISLQNKGSKTETYAFEKLTSEGALILDVAAVEQNGEDAVRIGTSGLPEIGPVAAGATALFKVRVRLIEGRISKEPQTAHFRMRSLTARPSIFQAAKLVIKEVVTGGPPTVIFSALADPVASIAEYALKDGGTNAMVFARIKNPDGAASSQYKIVINNNAIVVTPYENGTCSITPVIVTGAVGAEGKLFCVQVDMLDKSTLDGQITFTDIATNGSATASIHFVRPDVIGFASDSYEISGTRGVKSDVTVTMINRGGDLDEEKYIVMFDGNSAQGKSAWKLRFSLDGKLWEDNIRLKKMAAGATAPLYIQIAVPSDVNEEKKWALRLAIRAVGSVSNTAITTLSLSLGSNDLKVKKELAIVSAKDFDRTHAPAAFAATSDHRIVHGDYIWYRVTVSNVSLVTARELVVRDPLPKHGVYVKDTAIATIIAPDAIATELSDGAIRTKATTLGANQKLILTYAVLIDFSE